jgi:F0F1-type ATP synthase alpha subunit
MPLERKLLELSSVKPVTEPLQTGIKAVDAMIPVVVDNVS